MSNKYLNLSDKLSKGTWKEVMRNGIKYYATGPHAGKIVGSIRGNKISAPTVSKPEAKKVPAQEEVPKKIKVESPTKDQVRVDQFASQTPERAGTKTPTPSMIYGYGPQLGKVSKVEYKSPLGSTCNLVGFVAFGKASVENQRILNEKLRSAEIVLSHIGVRFKTPVDFVCQQLKEAMHGTQASFVMLSGINNRIVLSKGGPSVQKSLMHEIGHAIDSAMTDHQGMFRSAEVRLTGDELTRIHAEMASIVRSSEYYETAKTSNNTKFYRYLNSPQEVFARGFEVYAYAKGKQLIKENKLSPEFLKSFKPDVFKTKNAKLLELDKEVKSLVPLDEQKLERYEDLRSQIKSIQATGASWLVVSPEKQLEYESKIVALFDRILTEDTIKKALQYISLGDKLVKGANSPYFVAVVPVNSYGEVLIGERREDGVWTTPGGGAEADETPTEAAVRECWEEAGLKVTAANLVLLDVASTPRGMVIYRFLLRTDQTDVTTKLDPDKEVRGWAWTKPSDFPSAMQNQKNRTRLETINVALMKYHGLAKGGLGSGIKGHVGKVLSAGNGVHKITHVHPHGQHEIYQTKYIPDQGAKNKERTKFVHSQDGSIHDSLEEAKMKDEVKKGGPGSGIEGHKTDRLQISLADKLLEKGGPGSGTKGHTTVRRKQYSWGTMRHLQPHNESAANPKVPVHPEHWKEIARVHAGEKPSSSFKDETGKKWDVNRHAEGGVAVTHNSIMGRYAHHVKGEDIEREGKIENDHHEATQNAKKENEKRSAEKQHANRVAEILSGQRPSRKEKAPEGMKDSGVGSVLARQFKKSEELEKGGPGSGQVGHHTARQPLSPAERLKVGIKNLQPKIKNKLETHLDALKNGAVIPGVATSSGKPIVTDMNATRAHKYDRQDHLDAIDVHHKMAKRIGDVAGKLKTAGRPVPKEAQDMVKFHVKQMRNHMKEHNSIEMKQNALDAAREAKKSPAVKKSEDLDNYSDFKILKAQTQMGGAIGDPDVDTGAFAQAKANGDETLMDRLYRAMDGFEFGEMPREIPMDRGTLHLSKVDDGMYSGYFTRETPDGLQDNARVRIDKINIPDLAGLITAKEWMSQVKPQSQVEEKSFAPLQPPQAVTSELDVPAPSMATVQSIQKDGDVGIPVAFSMDSQESMPRPPEEPPQAPNEATADKAIRILSLISKLVGN